MSIEIKLALVTFGIIVGIILTTWLYKKCLVKTPAGR